MKPWPTEVASFSRLRIFLGAFFCIALGAVIILSAAPIAPRLSADSSAPSGDPQQLVAKVVQNEVAALQGDHSCWEYRVLQLDHGRKELRAVAETREGTVDRLLAVDSRPVDAQQRQAEDRRIRMFLSHPEQIRDDTAKRRKDEATSLGLMKMLPQAFLYKRTGDQGGLVVLAFTPNPSFRPATRQATVFHHMQGTMWIDSRALRLARLDGKLTSSVKFGGGMLGYLNPGGTFSVKQADVGKGHWDSIALDVNMSGKALFFKTIGVREARAYSDYREISPSTTLRQAAADLSHDSGDTTADFLGAHNN
jgi:hypothetical protein